MNARSRRWGTAATVLLVGSLAACGSSSSGSSGYGYGSTPSATSPHATASASPTYATKAPAQAASVGTAMTSLGTILVDGKGRSLYMYGADTQGSGKSACAGACLAAWPPLTGAPSAGSGVDASKLGTITGTDGSTQVTYNGWPLYYFAKDSAAGQTTGQGVGGIWWVVSPQGEPIKG